MLNPRLLLVAVIWGVNFAVVKYALEDFYPLSFTVVRFALSSLFLITVMLLTREPLEIESRDVRGVITLGFIGIFMYNLLFMYGLNYTSATNSSLFISLSPLFAAVIPAAFYRQIMSPRTWAGLALSTAGVFLVISGKTGGLTFTRSGIAGDLLTLCASIFWALYTLAAKPLLERYSPIKITAYSMASGTLMLLPVGTYELMHQSWTTISIPSWTAFIFSTFLSGGVAFTLWYEGVKKIGVTRTVVYHYLVPFIAVVFAAFFLAERITVSQVLGGILILAGVFTVQSKHA